MDRMPLSCTLIMVKMVNLMLCVFDYNTLCLEKGGKGKIILDRETLLYVRRYWKGSLIKCDLSRDVCPGECDW